MDLSSLLKNRGWVPKGANIFDYEITPDTFSRIALYPNSKERSEALGIVWVRIQSTEDGDEAPEDIWELSEGRVVEIVADSESENEKLK